MAAADTAVSGEGLSIPLIDFSLFTSGEEAQRVETAKAILRGFQTAGFVYLRNHPIPAADLARVYGLSAQFFAQPIEAKMACVWTTPEANRGYSAPGREKVTQLADHDEVEKLRQTVPDMKESYEIGREGEEGHPNQWPEEGAIPAFKPTMMSFFDACNKVNATVMRALALGMGLAETYFDGFVDMGDNTLRLLHYRPVKASEFRAGGIRAGAHTDYGSITLLFQDERGGLQVQSPTGVFIDARPIEGTIVINAGDLLTRWSSDTIRSTVHRVVEPPRPEAEEDAKKDGDKEYPPRYSIAYFCNPNYEATIDAIPGTYKSSEDKKYAPIKSGDYLVQRLTATY